MFDILFLNAKIYDGTGCPAYFADVGVADGKIAAIAKGLKDARRTVDARGLALAPGFIDAHSHADMVLDQTPSSWYKLEQGITTEITGTCGLSGGPIAPDYREDGVRIINRLPSPPADVARRATFPGYMDTLDIPLGPNVAMQMGHGSLRAAVCGFANRPLSRSEQENMHSLAVQGMQAGAVGVSFGLIYPPGIYADESECTELCRVIARHGGTFSIHMRYEGDRVIESVESVIRMAEQAGIRGIISHHKAVGVNNWGKSARTLELIDKANERGVEIFLDQYPYEACSTGLKTMIPADMHALGVDKLVSMLDDRAGRAQIRDAMEHVVSMEPGGDTVRATAEHILIGDCGNPGYAGRMLRDIAAERGADILETAMDILRDDMLETNAIFFVMGQEDILRIMKHPRCMVGSDGLYAGKGGFAHPRAYATFPRFLGRYVRDNGVLPLEEGVRKMTSMPAAVYGLNGKGLLRRGMDADLVLFDPSAFIDNADFKNYDARCGGLAMVLVNGAVAVEKGVYNGRLNGRLIRK